MQEEHLKALQELEKRRPQKILQKLWQNNVSYSIVRMAWTTLPLASSLRWFNTLYNFDIL